MSFLDIFSGLSALTPAPLTTTTAVPEMLKPSERFLSGNTGLNTLMNIHRDPANPIHDHKYNYGPYYDTAHNHTHVHTLYFTNGTIHTYNHTHDHSSPQSKLLLAAGIQHGPGLTHVHLHNHTVTDESGTQTSFVYAHPHGTGGHGGEGLLGGGLFGGGNHHAGGHHHHAGGHHAGGHHGGGGGGLGGSLSSWYQVNMGLIGIGALAVVAIIGSRNFFSNFLAQKFPYGGGDHYYGSHDPYYNDYRRQWYEDWYDQWYKDNLDRSDTTTYEQEYNSNNYYDHAGRYRRSRYKRHVPGILLSPSVAPRGDVQPSVTDPHCAFYQLCIIAAHRKRPLSSYEMQQFFAMRCSAIEKNTVLSSGHKGATEEALNGEGREPDGGKEKAVSPERMCPPVADLNMASTLGASGLSCGKLRGSCTVEDSVLQLGIKNFERQLKKKKKKHAAKNGF